MSIGSDKLEPKIREFTKDGLLEGYIPLWSIINENIKN
jgi:hypothetical protein